MGYLGHTTLPGLWKALSAAEVVKKEHKGKNYIIAPSVLAEENAIVEACKAGMGKFEKMSPLWQIQDEGLNEQQREAARHIFQSTDFITGIKGYPGVGKTRLLHELRAGVEARLNRFRIYAPWGTTVHDVLREEGFREAETIERLLRNADLQKIARDSIWFIDEAGLISTKDMWRLIHLAKELDSRIVLVGDIGQHLPVERGQAFRLLEEQAGMKTAELTEILRQSGVYKRAAELLAKRDFDPAFEIIRKMDCVCELPFEELLKVLASDYMSAYERGESLALISPTHKERRKASEFIREKLKEAGVIKSNRMVPVVEELKWTEAEKSDPSNYRPGMLIQIEGIMSGFRMNEGVEVVMVREDMVKVRSLNPYHQRARALPLNMPAWVYP